jgi:hypothetical protein
VRVSSKEEQWERAVTPTITDEQIVSSTFDFLRVWVNRMWRVALTVGKNSYWKVRFQVLIEASMNSAVFWVAASLTW